LGGSYSTGEIRVVIEIEAVPTTSPPLGFELPDAFSPLSSKSAGFPRLDGKLSQD